MDLERKIDNERLSKLFKEASQQLDFITKDGWEVNAEFDKKNDLSISWDKDKSEHRIMFHITDYLVSAPDEILSDVATTMLYRLFNISTDVDCMSLDEYILSGAIARKWQDVYAERHDYEKESIGRAAMLIDILKERGVDDHVLDQVPALYRMNPDKFEEDEQWEGESSAAFDIVAINGNILNDSPDQATAYILLRHTIRNHNIRVDRFHLDEGEWCESAMLLAAFPEKETLDELLGDEYILSWKREEW